MKTLSFLGRAQRRLALPLALVALACGGARPAQAQVAEDAFLRAWMDLTFYTGSPGNGPKMTVLAPVLQGDVKVLDLVRAGLDLPFAAGFVSGDPNNIVFNSDGSQFTLANPTLHGSIEIESGPLFASAGLGIALSVRDDDIAVGNADDLAGAAALTFGAATRGMWNAWWYADRHAVFAPGEIRYRGQDTAFGVDGALIAFIPRSDTPDTVDTAAAMQIGAYIAAVTGKTSMLGVRFRNFIAFTNDVLGSDKAQSSLEAFAEARVMQILLLGGGVLVNLDEPFGVFGDGLDIWSVRVKAGLAL